MIAGQSDKPRRIHDNSRRAYHENRDKIGKRAKLVLAVSCPHMPLTDREILKLLFPDSDNLNLVRPRITELVNAGLLREHDDVTDPITGKRVRRTVLTMAPVRNEQTKVQGVLW